MKDTICSLATGGGTSAIAIIRISGQESIKIANTIFNKDLNKIQSHSICFGNIVYENQIIDEVIITLFKQGKSYTGEETVEISCHGSNYIQNRLLQILINQGCRIAEPGEFTMRAFYNGKIDLSQAESIADLIASASEKEQQVAIKQLKGNLSGELKELRRKLIDFASLIELELDFSEEDVEFADRKLFNNLLKKIKNKITKLLQSYQLGNSIRNGIPVAIIGAPNVGKSTLLNTLVKEEKAIVSEIAGTTRDSIEDKLIINGFTFHFIDTAGIRETSDKIEQLGIKKTLEKAEKSEIILFLIDANNIKLHSKELKKIKKKDDNRLIPVINKIDENPDLKHKIKNAIQISAKNATGIDQLKDKILDLVNNKKITNKDTIVTNTRHYEALQLCLDEINHIIIGLKNETSSDFISINIRQALYHLGSITGEVTTDTLLENIFSKFCIGK